MKKTKSESEAAAGMWDRLYQALRKWWRPPANVCQTPESTEPDSLEAACPSQEPKANLLSAKILIFPPQPGATSTPSEPVSQAAAQNASTPLPPQVAKDYAEEVKIERRRRWQAVALLSVASCVALLTIATLLSFELKAPVVRDWLVAIASEPQKNSFGDGSSVEFDSATRLSFNADGNPCHVWMSAGEATFDVKECQTEPVLVSSPLAVARADSDAKFTMSVAKATSVYVHEGEIELLVAGTVMSTKVKRGQKAIVSPDSQSTVLVAGIAADERPLRERIRRRVLEERVLRMARVAANRSPASTDAGRSTTS